ncbi:WD40 repeat domain-containing protein [Nodularia sp. UHCC 0506]|uniref:WD40 repeat domain-containing protein n=1 Tax=Nodularia sp. UHCC 0506 TaxID=3110243 RepID=UPI002B206DC7|nr:WD40 repeat domain-containing protein [Nodularia sp. UHCC 0506]MEA5514600.1 WD40 repeat domain-containing protein [Nodularia sp. UHCC 0506]
MAVSLINTHISTKILELTPGASPASFEVSVVNESNQFASFELQIIAAGSSSDLHANWYDISPAVSAKKPPGDITKFHVTITDTPIPGFVGKMNIIVRIFSLELGEDRKILRLIVEPGTASVPMTVDLPIREFSAQPETLIEIPVRVINSSQISTHVSLRFCGVETQWLLDGHERLLQIAAGQQAETSFLCQLPVPDRVERKIYPFTIEATHNNSFPSSSPQGLIKVLPGGFLDFKCIPEKQRIPASRRWFPQWRTNSTTYLVECRNASNLSQQVHIEMKKGEEEQRKCFWEIVPEVIQIKPGNTEQFEILVSKRRRWFGLAEKLSFIIKGVVSDQRVNVNNENLFLRLTIHPVLHPWLQLILLILLLVLLWAVSWLNPNSPFFGHQRAVNSVQFNGVGGKAISGSQDQGIIRWHVPGFTNPLVNQHDIRLAKDAGKSVRVVRYKPVDNDVVAAGLENGEIQIWNVIGGTNKPKATFILNKDDRVFGLEFSQSSRSLFSGHGSGLVLQWDINNVLLRSATSGQSNIIVDQPLFRKQVNFAVSDLALIGQQRQNLLIGGRYNNLVMWNREEDSLIPIKYNPPGSQNDYITSLDSAEHRPNRLVTSDTNGQITVWDTESCAANNNGECEVIDRWSNGHGGQAVRSVSISNDGCYLASGGDDNRVMLWPLTTSGKRSEISGKLVRSAAQKYNSVDIKLVNQRILIISGNDNKQVRVDIQQPDKSGQCQE